MDKEVSGQKPVRSPLSSILNISCPTSEEVIPEDEIFNAPTIESVPSSATLEYASENEPPQVQVAQEVRLTSPQPTQIRVSRSHSLDVHFPTQLDTIAEVSTKASSRDDIRPQRSQSLDEGRLESRLFQTSSNDGAGYLAVIGQYPKEPVLSPPERMTTPPNTPRFNTRRASSYRIPAPPLPLRERLSGRPSPERLSWIRQTSSLPNGAIGRADDGTLVSGIWYTPRSDHTGGGRRVFDPARDPFDPPLVPCTIQSNDATPRDLEDGLANQEKPKVQRWKRF